MAESKIQKKYKGYGSYVNLNAYNSSSNKYIIPTDGIVFITGYWEQGTYVLGHICDKNGTNILGMNVGSPSNGNNATNPTNIAPVFAGMQVWYESNKADKISVLFFPYV